jgi:hypothetical protein
MPLGSVWYSTGPDPFSKPATSSATPKGRLCARVQQPDQARSKGSIQVPRAREPHQQRVSTTHSHCKPCLAMPAPTLPCMRQHDP